MPRRQPLSCRITWRFNMVHKTDQTAFAPQPISHDDGALAVKKKRRRSPWISITLGLIGCLLGATGIAMGLYNQALLPVDSKDSTTRAIEIVSGSTPDHIAKTLKEQGVIRSELAFSIYTRLQGVRNKLQAGTYHLSPSEPTQRIAAALVKGAAEQEFEITFLPGATLHESKKVLLRAGFEEEEIEKAFTTRYDHPLFESRPASADLEGYLYGETHRFTEGTPLETVLRRFFDDYYAVVERDNLVAAYKKQGLTLFEGITLASIIQRESGGDDEAQIAQVFLLRLDKGIQLGSDVTYQYIADKLGVARDVNLNNPYNTRRFTGLPPGPIASPGVKALRAVANPAKGDYLYFLSGDDDVTYFARTESEHEENIQKHCQKKCQIL